MPVCYHGRMNVYYHEGQQEKQLDLLGNHEMKYFYWYCMGWYWLQVVLVQFQEKKNCFHMVVHYSQPTTLCGFMFVKYRQTVSNNSGTKTFSALDGNQTWNLLNTTVVTALLVEQWLVQHGYHG